MATCRVRPLPFFLCFFIFATSYPQFAEPSKAGLATSPLKRKRAQTNRYKPPEPPKRQKRKTWRILGIRETHPVVFEELQRAYKSGVSNLNTFDTLHRTAVNSLEGLGATMENAGRELQLFWSREFLSPPRIVQGRMLSRAIQCPKCSATLASVASFKLHAALIHPVQDWTLGQILVIKGGPFSTGERGVKEMRNFSGLYGIKSSELRGQLRQLSGKREQLATDVLLCPKCPKDLPTGPYSRDAFSKHARKKHKAERWERWQLKSLNSYVKEAVEKAERGGTTSELNALLTGYGISAGQFDAVGRLRSRGRPKNYRCIWCNKDGQRKDGRSLTPDELMGHLKGHRNEPRLELGDLGELHDSVKRAVATFKRDESRDALEVISKALREVGLPPEQWPKELLPVKPDGLSTLADVAVGATEDATASIAILTRNARERHRGAGIK